MSNPNNGDLNPNQGFYPYMPQPGHMPDQLRHPHHMQHPMAGQGFMPHGMPMDPESLGLQDPRRQYKKKKTWYLTLNVTIETPSLDNKYNESFKVEIGSNQRLKVLQDAILASVKNTQVKELFKNEKMFIYIDGKHPVHRKSKSL